MIRLKYFFFLLPFILLSQDSFLKNLWIGNSSINNQNFSLNLYGVIYQSKESKDKYMGFHSTPNYILDSDNTLIKKYFLNSKLITIDNANHWVHFDQKEKFLDIVKNIIV